MARRGAARPSARASVWREESASGARESGRSRSERRPRREREKDRARSRVAGRVRGGRRVCLSPWWTARLARAVSARCYVRCARSSGGGTGRARDRVTAVGTGNFAASFSLSFRLVSLPLSFSLPSFGQIIARVPIVPLVLRARQSAARPPRRRREGIPPRRKNMPWFIAKR